MADKKSKTKKNDTGSPESQIRVFTERINSINAHLKNNKKDNSSKVSGVISSIREITKEPVEVDKKITPKLIPKLWKIK